MTNYIQSNQVSRIAESYASYVLRASDSGKLILLEPPLAAQTLFLPSLQAGLRFKIMATGNFTALHTSTITPTFNGLAVNGKVFGTCINITPGAAGAAVVAAVTKGGTNNIIFAATAVLGDYIDLTCDGSNWYISGISSAVGFA